MGLSILADLLCGRFARLLVGMGSPIEAGSVIIMVKVGGVDAAANTLCSSLEPEEVLEGCSTSAGPHLSPRFLDERRAGGRRPREVGVPAA